MPGDDVREGGFFHEGWLLAGYLVLSVIFFLPALLPGNMIFGTDYVSVAYFLEEFVTERFAAGTLPQWIPYLYGGMPFFANPMDTYYPVTLLLRLAGVPTYMHLGLIFVIQFWLAGLGMYLLLRELGSRTMPAWVGGLAFMFTGYLISYIYGGHDGRAIVATLAPLFLFALHRGIRTGGLRWFVLGGATIGSAMLSFQIQSSYYLLLAGGLWGAFLLWHMDVLRPTRTLVSRLAGGALTVALGFAMNAVNFLPFLGYVAASPRGGEGGRGYDYATSWSMAPEELVGLAVPERIGILDAYWGMNAFKLHTEYVGALVLLLAVVGFYLLRRSGYMWFFAALGIFILTLVFGSYTPIYQLYYELLPGTDKFRAPSIAFFLLSLSLVVIAGLALNRLGDLWRARRSKIRQESESAASEIRIATYIGLAALALTVLWGLAVMATAPPAPIGQPRTLEALRAAKEAANHPAYVAGVWRFILFLSLSMGALALWLRDRLNVRTVGLLLGLIAVADLWIIDKKFLDSVPAPSIYYAPGGVATFLRQQEGRPFRTLIVSGFAQKNYLMHFDLALVAGSHGNQLQSYNEFLGAGERSYTNLSNLGSPAFLALANARYLVSTAPVRAGFMEPVFQGRTRSGRPARVYLNRIALPRAFLVPTAERVPAPDGALERMHEASFQPARTVLVYEDPPNEGSPPDAFRGSARVLRYEPSEVVVETIASGPGYLVLTDNYYEDWNAYVDGSPAPLLRADHTFRTVPVPAGTHRVVFRFESIELKVGFAITVALYIALIVYGLALAFMAWRRRDTAA